MMTPFPANPAQMRREAEHAPREASPRPGPEPRRGIDPEKRPPLASDGNDLAEQEATADWLAHIQAGRIHCPEPVEGEIR